MGRFVCLSLFASALAAVAAAEPAAPNTTTAQTPLGAADGRQPPADPQICQIQREIGSMFSHKVCLTKLEWDRVARDSQDYSHDNMINSSHGGRVGH